MSFNDNIKVLNVSIDNLQNQRAIKIGDKVFVVGIGKDSIPIELNNAIKVGYATVDGLGNVTFNDIVDNTTESITQLYVTNTGVDEPLYDGTEFIATIFRYIKFEILNNRNGGGTMQLSQVSFFDSSNNKFVYPSDRKITSIGNSSASDGQSISNVYDNDTGNKYCNTSFQNGIGVSIIIDLGSNQNNYLNLSTYIKYGYYTGNDSYDRDPSKFNLYVSNDNSNWTLLDSQNLQSSEITTDRNALVGYFTIGE